MKSNDAMVDQSYSYSRLLAKSTTQTYSIPGLLISFVLQVAVKYVQNAFGKMYPIATSLNSPVRAQISSLWL